MCAQAVVKIQVPELHAGQTSIKRDAGRYNIVCCGRRYGKNVLLTEIVIDTALERGLPSAWFAPTYKMLTEDWRNLRNTLAPVTAGISEQEKQIRLLTGGVIDMWSLENPDSARGRKYGRVVVNEAGLVPNLVDIVNMVIRPMLVDYRGDLWLAGTPKGMGGFYQLFNTDGWQKWQRSSYDNPHIPKDELDALKDVLTDRAYRQEILAEFIADGAGVYRFVRDAATSKPLTARRTNRQYCVGVDWGRTEDATVFSVLDMQSKEQVCMDRMTQTDYGLQVARLKALNERFRPTVILAEYNSMGGPLVEQLQREGLPVRAFVTTNATKAEIVEQLALAFEQRAISILDDPVQVAELQAYESERLPSGLVRYNAPEGSHDDTVISLALSWHACTFGGARARVREY